MKSPKNISAYIEYPDEQTYLAFKAVSSDKEKMFGQPYEDWLAQGRTFKDNAKRQGIELLGIQASPEEFVAWCKENTLDTDSKGRAAFAAYKLAKQLEETE